MSALLSPDENPEDNPFRSSPPQSPTLADRDDEALDESRSPPPALPADQVDEGDGEAVSGLPGPPPLDRRESSSGAIRLRDDLSKKDAIQVHSIVSCFFSIPKLKSALFLLLSQ
jgi:hypothetical protein